MQNIKKYNIIAILTISVVAGIFNNIPLSYAQDNSTMTNTPMTNLTQTRKKKKRNILLLRQAIQQKKKKKNIMKQML